jgi:hypothetical protein
MVRFLKYFGLALAVLTASNQARAFSLLGPLDTWQTVGLGYNPLNTDIGGPMNLGEEYRWNIKTITYGFDPSFVNYFGPRGVAEVNKAIAILNALPPFSKMSSNLNEYSLNTRRVNYQASALQMYDLKSVALAALVEELGLTSPDRYVWALRDRVAIVGGFQYTVITRNFDPITYFPTPFVNGNLYTYVVLDPVPNFNVVFADAVELTVDPFAPEATAVASEYGSLIQFALQTGDFYIGLTRDDVAGLRYLYNRRNYNVEGLLPGTLAGGGGAPWTPVSGGTNGGVDIALRGGVDKITFRQVKFESVFGQFIPITNRYVDTYILNSRSIKQNTQRALATPDIVFSAADLGTVNGYPVRTTRTDTGNWINNAGTNFLGGTDATITAGPGVIQPPVFITFNKVGPFNINFYSDNSFFLDEESATAGFVWGSFDGSTNAPFIYPSDPTGQGFPLQQLETLIQQRQ